MAKSKESNPVAPAFAFPAGSLFDPTPFTSLLHEWQTELFSHYVGRCQRYASIPMKLACCVSADDLAEVQADFFRQLVEDYRLKAERLLEVARRRGEGAAAEGEAEYSARLLKAQEDAGEIIRQAKEQAARILADAEKAATAANPAAGEGATRAA